MFGIFVVRRVPDRLRVEHDQIRGASRRDEPLLARNEPTGRESGHLPDRLSRESNFYSLTYLAMTCGKVP
jgi:hypothetical protein